MNILAILDLFSKKEGDSVGGQDSPLNINVGSSGLLNVETVDKRLKYANRLNEVTNQTIRDMAQVFEDSRTKTQAFMKMEDRGIPLDYMIALGLTTEEQVYAYQTIRERGLIEELSQRTDQVGSSMDEDYAMEILKLSRPIPKLKTIDDVELDEQLTLEELNGEMTQEVIMLRSKVRELEYEIQTKIDQTRYEDSIRPEDQDTAYEREVLSGLKEVDEVDVYDLTIATDEEVEERNKSMEWQKKLNKLKQLNTERMVNETETKSTEGGDEVTNAGLDVRNVYILSSKFNVDPIEGYEINFIEKTVDLNYFTSSRNNLMIITNNIPRYIVSIFVDWIKGVTDMDGGYRMVTLKGAELTHPLIEGTIELTKESLDEYYENHTLEQYTGNGVGSFLDISHILDDGN